MCRPAKPSTAASTEFSVKASFNSKNKQLVDSNGNRNSPFLTLLVLPLLCYGSFKFASILPSIFSPNYAHLYYIPANYYYTKANCHFCNTVWTWGTDYIIAVYMARSAYLCLQRSKNTTTQSSSIRRSSSLLFSLYCISVLSGGIGHQYYTKVEEMNSLSFRILWFICVGSVCMAGGIIGIIGTKFGRACNVDKDNILPEHFWIGYGMIMALACANGLMSYQRPACDIFMAGTTQCAPTFYNIYIMFNIYLLKQQKSTNEQMKKHSLYTYLKYTFSYLLNCPPLPIYTILLRAQIPTSVINTYLHANLFFTWNCQGYFIRYFIDLLEDGV